jgi:hypothetical protein
MYSSIDVFGMEISQSIVFGVEREGKRGALGDGYFSTAPTGLGPCAASCGSTDQEAMTA